MDDGLHEYILSKKRSDAYLRQSIKRCTTERDVAARIARRVRVCHEMHVCSKGDEPLTLTR